MKQLLAIILCAVIPVVGFASNDGYTVTYDGGSVPDIKTGTGLKLFIESGQIRLMKSKADLVTIPVGAITEISYGQDVHRRVGAAIGLAVVSFASEHSWL